MIEDKYIVDGKAYTHTTQRRRQLKLKEWGIHESVFRSTVGSSAENIYPGEVFFINTDRYGCIDNENGVESEEKIAVLSGSYVECMFMKPTERLISCMERLLNERINHTHTHTQGSHSVSSVQCMNCAMSGTHILHSLFVLLAKIVPMNVKTVVYVVDINEFRAAAMADGDYYTHHKNLSIFTHTKEDPPKQKPDYTHFRKFIRDFWSICKIHGIRCVFAGRTYANGDKRSTANTVAKKVCESLKCDYIDLSEGVKNLLQARGEDLSTEEKYNECMDGLTYDTTHLTAQGAAIVGEVLADELYSLLYK